MQYNTDRGNWRAFMELKARLATLENQINSLQALLVNDQNYNNNTINNTSNQENLKSILISKKLRSLLSVLSLNV